MTANPNSGRPVVWQIVRPEVWSEDPQDDRERIRGRTFQAEVSRSDNRTGGYPDTFPEANCARREADAAENMSRKVLFRSADRAELNRAAGRIPSAESHSTLERPGSQRGSRRTQIPPPDRSAPKQLGPITQANIPRTISP